MVYKKTAFGIGGSGLIATGIVSIIRYKKTETELWGTTAIAAEVVI